MKKEKHMTKYESAEEKNRIGTYIYGSRNKFFHLIPIPYSIYKFNTNLLTDLRDCLTSWIGLLMT